jgi:hypothetical protein
MKGFQMTRLSRCQRQVLLSFGVTAAVLAAYGIAGTVILSATGLGQVAIRGVAQGRR